MKKENIDKLKNFTIVVLVLIIVFGASYFASELQECDSYSAGNSSSDLNDIDIDEYLDLKESSDASIIYIARPTCGYCQQEEPIVKNIVYEYGITVNYLNTDNLDDDGQAKLIKSDDYFSEGYGTPLLLVVKDDEIVDILKGLSDKDTIVNFFKENGFINE